MRILLVEDETALAHWVARALGRQAGYVVAWADDGALAERRLQLEEFDAIVLDLGLPGLDGQSLLTRMRARGDTTPVLILTARDSLAARVDTLHQGADDFLAKPFRIEELEARLVALVRRSRGREHARFACGSLVLDTAAQRFTVGDAPLQLTPREHRVLRVFIQRSGEPLSKQQILERVSDDDTDTNLEAIEVLVHRLRKKLAGTDVQIVTLRGLGYCLEAVADTPGS
ncbi:response regulator [Verticiella sediminum]|uniref:Response regulator n=1 Tax=Verticiella sediminum TaxID=1247510 RepID=A0A556AUA6_9BURK|nr:response regulator [Verticiella sediminum]TSH96521.1 response regulator [Verticiella sediminum]